MEVNDIINERVYSPQNNSKQHLLQLFISLKYKIIFNNNNYYYYSLSTSYCSNSKRSEFRFWLFYQKINGHCVSMTRPSCFCVAYSCMHMEFDEMLSSQQRLPQQSCHDNTQFYSTRHIMVYTCTHAHTHTHTHIRIITTDQC